jgi:hypothetical protein
MAAAEIAELVSQFLRSYDLCVFIYLACVREGHRTEAIYDQLNKYFTIAENAKQALLKSYVGDLTDLDDYGETLAMWYERRWEFYAIDPRNDTWLSLSFKDDAGDCVKLSNSNLYDKIGLALCVHYTKTEIVGD